MTARKKKTFPTQLLPDSLKRVVPKDMDTDEILLYISAYQRGVEDTQDKFLDRIDGLEAKMVAPAPQLVKYGARPTSALEQNIRGPFQDDDEEYVEWAPAPDEAANIDLESIEKESDGEPQSDFARLLGQPSRVGHFDEATVKEMLRNGMSMVPPSMWAKGRTATLRWLVKIEPKFKEPPDLRMLHQELLAKGLIPEQVETMDYDATMERQEGEFAN
jgi:hypothetical protein